MPDFTVYACVVAMNDAEKRSCPFCAETISAKAKLCPRCRQWLSWKSFRHPLILMLTLVVPVTFLWIALGFAMLSSFSKLTNPKPLYGEFPNSLKVLESRMNWAPTENGLAIYLTGVLTNTSPVAWKDAEFDCRFFDAKGGMLDAGTGHSFFTVLPHDDVAFRVSIMPTAPTNEYYSFTISVGNAWNARSLF